MGAWSPMTWTSTWRARWISPIQIGTFQPVRALREAVPGGQQYAAGSMPPGANERRQAGDIAHGHAATAHAL